MTTNYYDTFISVAEDCPVAVAEVPVPKSDKPTVASREYDILINNPYTYTSDDVLFTIHAERNGIKPDQDARNAYFAKGQPCLRSSPLTKRYGWGVHSNSEGKIAIYAFDSPEYANYVHDPTQKQLKAMRSKRA